MSILGVNIDHVATVRRLRDTSYPDLLSAAGECMAGGADQITVHLREDRRHITDEDVKRLKENLKCHLNLEMAATEEMLKIALSIQPFSICIVPEKREEKTTEGGLDLSSHKRHPMLQKITEKANFSGIRVSFFIEPNSHDIEMSKALGAKCVELHTGKLCIAHQKKHSQEIISEWEKLHHAIKVARELNLAVAAGHGIDYQIAPKLARLKGIEEYNIGHAIISESIFCGISAATRKMKEALTINAGKEKNL